jgi:hypothetical protein
MYKKFNVQNVCLNNLLAIEILYTQKVIAEMYFEIYRVVDTFEFGQLVHEQPLQECPLGLRHATFQYLPVTSPVSVILYYMSHTSGTSHK